MQQILSMHSTLQQLHFHRVKLASVVLFSLRDMRQDLFAHMELRPSSFYDRVAIGRVMTRITNDVQALIELLMGLGALIGQFVPFFIALFVMFAINAELTLYLLGAIPLFVVVTYFFRQATRKVYRLIRNTVSQLNQNLQENRHFATYLLTFFHPENGKLMIAYDDIVDEGPDQITFTAQAFDVASDEVKVTWSFPDGSMMEGNFAQYTFRDDGEYLVTVTAEDEDGGVTQEMLKVTVNNVAPQFIQFEIPTGGEEGTALDFQVSATDPGDDTIVYTFDFGDDTAVLMSEDGNMSHKFAEGDTFTVVICAKDEDGGETCRTDTIPVSLLQQAEEEGLLPGFSLFGVISALGIIGILRRRTH